MLRLGKLSVFFCSDQEYEDETVRLFRTGALEYDSPSGAGIAGICSCQFLFSHLEADMPVSVCNARHKSLFIPKKQP